MESSKNPRVTHLPMFPISAGSKATPQLLPTVAGVKDSRAANSVWSGSRSSFSTLRGYFNFQKAVCKVIKRACLVAGSRSSFSILRSKLQLRNSLMTCCGTKAKKARKPCLFGLVTTGTPQLLRMEFIEMRCRLPVERWL